MYIYQTYDDRMFYLAEAMSNINQLMTIYDDDKYRDMYDALCEKFAEETKDIPNKNGIKKINNHITYYANGLIDYSYNSRYAKLIAKPFDYENNSKIPKPKYNLFKRDKYCGYYRTSTDNPDDYHNASSDLIGSYLRYKLKHKSSDKTPKITDYLESLKSFMNLIRTPNYTDDKQNYEIFCQYEMKYQDLLTEYLKILAFVTNVKSDTMNPDTCAIGSRSTSRNMFIPMMHKNNNENMKIFMNVENYDLDRIITNMFDPGNPCAVIQMPMLSDESVEKIIKMYNDLYYEKVQNIESYKTNKHQTIKKLYEQIENSVQEDIRKYYKSVVVNLESELLKNDRTYSDWGYGAMIAERNYDDPHENKIPGYERIMMHSKNKCVYTESYDDIIARNNKAYASSVNSCNLFSYSYNYAKRTYMIRTEPDMKAYPTIKNKYYEYLDIIKISVEFMIACIEDIISSLSHSTNNTEFKKWMIKKHIIPETTIANNNNNDLIIDVILP